MLDNCLIGLVSHNPYPEVPDTLWNLVPVDKRVSHKEVPADTVHSDGFVGWDVNLFHERSYDPETTKVLGTSWNGCKAALSSSKNRIDLARDKDLQNMLRHLRPHAPEPQGPRPAGR